MKLMEAIVDANHRALAGDKEAGLRPDEFAAALPIVALSCIDVRLNALLPQVLGVPPEQFIWLRNAGNIITGPVSSTMRSLALACAVKGGREIVIIGHTDCAVGRSTTSELIDRFRALGIERSMLPENLTDYFGTFASERANVIAAAGFVRASPLISPRLAVHGLLVDIETGKLDWVVDGYQSLQNSPSRPTVTGGPLGRAGESIPVGGGLPTGGIGSPHGQIGDRAHRPPAAVPPALVPPPTAPTPRPAGPRTEPSPAPKLPLPPRIPPGMGKPRVYFRR